MVHNKYLKLKKLKLYLDFAVPVWYRPNLPVLTGTAPNSTGTGTGIPVES